MYIAEAFKASGTTLLIIIHSVKRIVILWSGELTLVLCRGLKESYRIFHPHFLQHYQGKILIPGDAVFDRMLWKGVPQ